MQPFLLLALSLLMSTTHNSLYSADSSKKMDVGADCPDDWMLTGTVTPKKRTHTHTQTVNSDQCRLSEILLMKEIKTYGIQNIRERVTDVIEITKTNFKGSLIPITYLAFQWTFNLPTKNQSADLSNSEINEIFTIVESYEKRPQIVTRETEPQIDTFTRYKKEVVDMQPVISFYTFIDNHAFIEQTITKVVNNS